MDKTLKATDKIKTRADFVVFLRSLLADYRANKHEWENKDLESFLEAFGRYAEDIDQMYVNTNQPIDADSPSWKVIADMFMGARIYE